MIRAKLKELEPKLESQILRKHQIERIRSIKRMGQHQQKSHHLGQGYFVLGRIGKFSIRAKIRETNFRKCQLKDLEPNFKKVTTSSKVSRPWARSSRPWQNQ